MLKRWPYLQWAIPTFKHDYLGISSVEIIDLFPRKNEDFRVVNISSMLWHFECDLSSSQPSQCHNQIYFCFKKQWKMQHRYSRADKAWKPSWFLEIPVCTWDLYLENYCLKVRIVFHWTFCSFSRISNWLVFIWILF